MTGTSADETVLMRDGGSVLASMAGGDDRVSGSSGNDNLKGGPGDDRLFGNGGKDVRQRRPRHRRLPQGGLPHQVRDPEGLNVGAGWWSFHQGK